MGYLEQLNLLHLSSVVQLVYNRTVILAHRYSRQRRYQPMDVLLYGGNGFLRSQTRRFGLILNHRTDRTTNDSALEQLARNWVQLPEEMT